MTSETLNINQAADYIGVHKNSALKMAAEGKIPGAKIGKSWVFHAGKLETWLLTEIEKQTHDRKPPEITKVKPKPGRRRRELPKLD